MKVIQVPMDEKLLRAINREAKASHSTRAALIRTACQEYLRRVEEEERDRLSLVTALVSRGEIARGGNLPQRLAHDLGRRVGI